VYRPMVTCLEQHVAWGKQELVREGKKELVTAVGFQTG